MQAAIDVIKKIFDFLGGLDYAKAFQTIEDVLVKLVEWIGKMAA